MLNGSNAAVEGHSVGQLLSSHALVSGIGAWLDRTGPRYERLAAAIADLVARESLPAGCRLPPERELAALLGVSRGTVVAAYGTLASEDVVVRRRGSGTRLAGEPVLASRDASRRLPAQLGRFLSSPTPQIDLAFGAPYVDDVVWQLHGRVADAMRGGAPAHGYAPLGLPRLRQGIAQRMTASGTPTSAEEVLVTSGAQGALALLTGVLLRPGDRVIVEAPTYPGAVELFSRAGASIIAVARDHAGPRPDDLRRALSSLGAAFVFLVPTCHNPTGTVMHEQRRRELLRVCRERDVIVVEDLTTADVLFEGNSPPTLSALDGGQRVITVSSFSKVIWGGLRVGWIAGSRSLILRLGRLKAARDLGTGLLDQAAAVVALDDLDAIIAQRRRMARERHDHLRGELQARLPEWDVPAARGGYSLWIRLPCGTGEDLAAAAMTRGVAIAPGSSTAPEDGFREYTRLCYSAPPELLTEAAVRLQAAWRSHLASPHANRL